VPHACVAFDPCFAFGAHADQRLAVVEQLTGGSRDGSRGLPGLAIAKLRISAPKGDGQGQPSRTPQHTEHQL
jgi:hypothetical protein